MTLIRNKSLVLCIIILLLITPPTMTVESSGGLSVSVGDYVSYGHYKNQAIVWQVIHIDEQGNPLLHATEVLGFKAFDAAEDYEDKTDTSNNAYRSESGNNRWAVSNIREWLNSDDFIVDYSTTIPSEISVSGGHNPYENEAGFLYGFSEIERLGILPVTQKSLISVEDIRFSDGGDQAHQFEYGKPEEVTLNYESSYYELIDDKVFLLSVNDLSQFIVGNGLDSLRYPNEQAIEMDDSGRFSVERTAPYWLRTPTATSATASRMVTIDGNVNYDNAYYSYVGIVPAIYLDNQITMIASGDGSKNTPYEISVEAIEAVFDDKNLEASVRSKIEKPSGTLYASELTRITRLDASSRQINDLTGIEHLINLEELDLSYNGITGFSQLYKMSKLKSLELQYNNIEDLEFLIDIMGKTTYEVPLVINLTGNSVDTSDDKILNTINLLAGFNVQVNFYEDVAANKEIEEIIAQYLGSLQSEALANEEKETLTLALEAVLKLTGTRAYKDVKTLYTTDENAIKQLSREVIGLEKEIYKQLKINDIKLNRELKTAITIELPSVDVSTPHQLLIDKDSVFSAFTDQVVISTSAYDIFVEPFELAKDFKRNEVLSIDVSASKQSVTQTRPVDMLNASQLENKGAIFAENILSHIRETMVVGAPEVITGINQASIIPVDTEVDVLGINFMKDEIDVTGLYSRITLSIKNQSINNYTSAFMFGEESTNIGGRFDELTEAFVAPIYESGSYYLGDNKLAINDSLDSETYTLVEYFVSKEVLTLDESGYFRPDALLTRAEVAKAFVEIAEAYNGNAENHFTDINGSHPLVDYVASSADKGIVSGYGDGTFRPDNNIVHGEFIKMMGAMLAYKQGYIYPSDNSPYITFENTSDISLWVLDYLALTIREGFIDVEQNPMYTDDSDVTRIEAIRLLYQLSQKL